MRAYLKNSRNFYIFLWLICLIGCGRRENPVIPAKEIISNCVTPGYAKDIFVLDNHAYIADGQGGLQIINISDPGNPDIVGYCDIAGYAQGIFVQDTFAYIAGGTEELLVFNVSDPQNPIEKPSATWPTDYANGIHILSRHDSVFTFISCRDYLRIFNCSEPEYAPSQIGKLTTPGDACGIFGDAGFVYIADEQMGFHIINIEDLSNPEIIGSCDTPGKALDVCISGIYAYIADGREGLQIIDISNEQDPKIIGSYDTPGYANKVFVLGDYAYIADGKKGLQIIDVSEPSSPSVVGECDTPYANSVYATEDYIYIADRDDGLVIIANR